MSGQPRNGRRDETAAEWAIRTAQEQGLPPYVEDEETLRRIALLLRDDDHDRKAA